MAQNEPHSGTAAYATGTTMRLNRSALRAVSLLTAVSEYVDGATPAMLATHTELPRPTVFRLLLSLEHAGLLTRKDGRFAASDGLASLGQQRNGEPSETS